MAVALILIAWAGCDKARPMVVDPPSKVMVRPASDARPPTPGADVSVGFEGATGNVRVTVEVEGGAFPPTLNDVLFQAVGSGKLTLQIRNVPSPGEGCVVTVGCRSGAEESSAKIEPRPLLASPDAPLEIESFAPPIEVQEGKEVVVARLVSKSSDRESRLTWKAIFTREPLAPRVKVGMKPTRS